MNTKNNVVESVESVSDREVLEEVPRIEVDLSPEGKKPIEVNIRMLKAIETPHSSNGKRLEIKPIVSMVQRVNYFQAVCSYTGIVMEVAIPQVNGLVLEYVNPLSYWDNVRGIIEQGEKYLERLEVQILAGLWITAYRHFELIDKISAKNNSSLLNAMIRTAGKNVLIDSLLMAGHLTERYARRCARFDVSYEAHKESPNMSAAIQEYTRAIRDSVYPPEALVLSKEEREIEAKYNGFVAIETRSSKKANHKIITVAEQSEERFKVCRREGKELLKAMAEEMIIPTAFISILKTVFTDRNLTSMASSLRDKMITKLESYQNANCQKMAKVLANGADPYDIFAIASEELENDSTIDSVPDTNRKLSLREILEAKKAARIAKETQEHFVEEQDKADANEIDTSGEEF